MMYYLVDSENDGGQASIVSKLLDEYNDKVKIFVFVSKATSSATKDLALQNPKLIKTLWCENGHKNAMDFCIASYVGKLLADHPGDECVICSNDAGYDAIVQFWTRMGKRVRRQSGKEPEANKKLKELDGELQEKITAVSAATGVSINNIILSCSKKESDYKTELRKKGYEAKQINNFSRLFTKTYRKQLRNAVL